MHKIGTSLRFEAAHQLEKGCFTEKCSDCIHGHSYLVEIEISCVVLDYNRMVIDFGELKAWKQTVDDYYDHALFLPNSKKKFYTPLIKNGELLEKKVHFWEFNPTAEWFAEVLYSDLCNWLRAQPNNQSHFERNLCIEQVKVWETANSYAVFRGKGML